MVRKVLYIIFIILALVSTALLVMLFYESKDGEPVTQTVGRTIKTMAEKGEPREFLLPDQIVTKPRNIYVSTDGEKRTIRFSTTFINQGDGPLEVLGHPDEEAGVTYAAQYVKERMGPGKYQDIGEFVYHPGHKHWHLEDYVFYQLIPSADSSETPITQTDKMSFCIWDEDRENSELPNASDVQIFPFDCARQIQGMSVGWSDTYGAEFEGQEMNITEIPDGEYIFRSIVNPDRKVEEKDYDNNTSEVRILLSGNNIEVIE